MMKTKLLALLIGSLFWNDKVQAQNLTEPTVIQNLNLEYAERIDLNNHPVGFGFTATAVVGGKVDFSGPAPVYVTINNGGQSYTALTDEKGYFTFYIYLNRSNNIEARAWVGSQVVHSKNKLTIK